MSRGLARVGDRTFGTCFHPSHFPPAGPGPIPIGGTIITGAPNVTAGNIANARVTDTVLTDCGHIDLIVSGSTNVTAANIGVARMGDSVGALGIYIASIITGAPNTTTP